MSMTTCKKINTQIINDLYSDDDGFRCLILVVDCDGFFKKGS